MKTFAHITLCVFILLALAGCNSDVFVDDFEPSVSELELDGNGDSATIRFNTSNWNLLEVYTFFGDPTRYKVYDADGKLLEENSEYPYIKGLGKIVCDNEKVDFMIERTSPDEVKITVNENVRSVSSQFMVKASNEYESKNINITISPSDRYIFHHITYSLDAYLYDGNETSVKERFIVYNENYSQPFIITFFPFRNGYRYVNFKSDDWEAFRLLEEGNVSVEIPSMEEGSLVMKGEQVQYTTEYQKLPLPFPDTEEKKVAVPAYTNQAVILLLQYEWFETEYTLYAVHPKTGKQRTIKGTLQSKMPVNYYIKRENINE